MVAREHGVPVRRCGGVLRPLQDEPRLPSNGCCQGGPEREAAAFVDHHRAASREDRTARHDTYAKGATLACRAEPGSHGPAFNGLIVRCPTFGHQVRRSDCHSRALG
jgi:hypothetical protein